jgi:hypothetical protein
MIQTRWNTDYYTPAWVPGVVPLNDGTQTLVATLIAIHGGYRKAHDIAYAIEKTHKTATIVLRQLVGMGAVTIHKPRRTMSGGRGWSYLYEVADAQDK